MMPEADFAALLRRHMGLDAESIGSSVVERAVRERQRATGSADAGAYWQRLCGDPGELQALVEGVVVPETWFFRDREAFAALTRQVEQTWQRSCAGRPLRLLSIPCSTGEEPYSMAMALLDAHVSSERFVIDAIDISEHAIEHARRARYGKNSFRSGELDFRDRHFLPCEGGHQLSDTVRRCVKFRAANLLGPELLAADESYDAVFCRNMLIYFEPDARARALQVVNRLLARDGWLFVGPSETSLVARGPFQSTGISLAFSFVKASSASKSAVPPGARRRHAKAAQRRPAAQPLAKAAHAPAQPARAEAEVDLDVAAKLADEGRLREAAQICSESLRLHGPSSRAYHLLGLLSEGAGQLDDAIAHHRKALYLNQGAHEAMLHLAYLLQKRGEPAHAERLRARAYQHLRKDKG